MNIFRSLIRWGSLYILVGIFIAVFFWEENLHIKPGDHVLLAIGILLGFGFLLDRWITNHETNSLISQFYEIQDEHEKSEHRLENKTHAEKKQ